MSLRTPGTPFLKTPSPARGDIIPELHQVEPMHVAAFVEQLGQRRAPAMVNQHLAALRMRVGSSCRSFERSRRA